MTSDLLAALALVFIIEGIFPFLHPRLWRRWLLALLDQSEQALRISGLLSMLLGLALLYAVR